MSTRAYDVKKALQALVSGSEFVIGEDVQVTYGFPTRAPERRWVWIGDVRWNSDEWATNRARSEEFGVAVSFSVQLAGGTAEESEKFVFALAHEFEDALRADPGLSGLCVTTSFQPRSLRSWPIDQAYEAQFDCEVTALCRP